MKCRVFPIVISCILSVGFCCSSVAAETGSLQITCEPGFQVYLDDKFMGVTGAEENGLHLREIEPGKHKVRAEKADSGVQKFSVQIKVGKTVKIKLGRDSAPMALIPAGEFQMGSNYGESDEVPVHTVHLDAFYMDMYEVTNALYRKFVDATGHKAPVYWNDSRRNSPDQPVVGVTWYDAKAYCKWAGKRLPTEAEWEKAARGGLVGKKYPWGNQDNTASPGSGGNEGVSGAFPVGSFAPNDYGLYGMARNAWEWCEDWYSEDYYSKSPERDPAGPGSGTARVLRGGSWFASIQTPLCVSYRYSFDPERTSNLIGFRCVH